VLLTIPSAVWATRTFGTHPPARGAAVGALVAAFHVITVREFSLEMIAAAALLVVSGWFGGVIASSFRHAGIAQRPPENR
jgi:hypothetical protein